MRTIFRRSKPPPSKSILPIHPMSSALPTKHETSIQSSPPVTGNWDGAHTTIGAGVAIFHLATTRVVVCYHSVDKYWFLPKGRRDADEDTGAGAEREGFEEVCELFGSYCR